MVGKRVIRCEDEVTASWVGNVLKQDVVELTLIPGKGNWSRQIAIEAILGDGTSRRLRLKICLGATFGRSEVDFYTRDYADMADAPLVRCFDAHHDPSLGYHVLLEDLSATHRDRREVPPSRAHGIAAARALGRMHRRHWGASPVPGDSALDRYFGEIRPGLSPMEHATRQPLRGRFEAFERAFRRRWSEPHGMSLLHGDLNPTNILTPVASETPVYFLDRQPFEWSLVYGVAVSDLAYLMIPWWPEETRRECEMAVLRHWHEAVDRPEYTWAQAVSDWRLSVEQCLGVPMEWCSKLETFESMRWLWEAQFRRVQDALARPGHDT